MPVSVGGLHFALLFEESDDVGAIEVAFIFAVFIVEEDDATELHRHKSSINKDLKFNQMPVEGWSPHADIRYSGGLRFLQKFR